MYELEIKTSDQNFIFQKKKVDPQFIIDQKETTS